MSTFKSSMLCWRLMFGLFVVHLVASNPRHGPVFHRLLSDILQMDDANDDCKNERDDCELLKDMAVGAGETLEEYCLRNRQNTAVKQCAKTCDFCKPPAPGDCKNERDNCELLKDMAVGAGETLEEYCLRNRQNTAVKQCAKTCDFCKAPAPGGGGECKDKRKDCNWILQSHAEKSGKSLDEYCEFWKGDPAVKACPKTCNFCKAPIDPIACKDERDCSFIVKNVEDSGETLEEYCEKWIARDDPAVKQCPKTCKVCP